MEGQQPEGKGLRDNYAAFLVPLLSAMAWAFVGLPVLRWLWQQWWTNDYYSHGILVFPIAVYILWRLWPEDAEWGGHDVGLVVMGVLMVTYIWLNTQRADYLAALVWILIGATLVWGLAGLSALRRVWFAFAFALLAVPLPFIEWASLPLAQVTGTWSAKIVSLLGVPVAVQGSQISLPNTNLVVGAQCSGLRSIVALVTLSALFSFIVSGPWWGRLILLFSAFPLALVGNLARVVSLLFVANRWGAEAGFNFYHNYSGYVFFLVAFAFLIMLARVVRCSNVRSDLL